MNGGPLVLVVRVADAPAVVPPDSWTLPCAWCGSVCYVRPDSLFERQMVEVESLSPLRVGARRQLAADAGPRKLCCLRSPRPPPDRSRGSHRRPARRCARSGGSTCVRWLAGASGRSTVEMPGRCPEWEMGKEGKGRRKNGGDGNLIGTSRAPRGQFTQEARRRRLAVKQGLPGRGCGVQPAECSIGCCTCSGGR